MVAKVPADELGEPVCIGGEDPLETLSLTNTDVLFRYEDCHLVGGLKKVLKMLTCLNILSCGYVSGCAEKTGVDEIALALWYVCVL